MMIIRLLLATTAVVMLTGTPAGLLATENTAMGEALLSNEASPDVYKVIAENDHVRVVEATWKPGQRDDWHYHPHFGAYFITDADGILHYPDGTSRAIKGPAGTAMAMDADTVPHSFENLSSEECKIVLVEVK